MRYFKIGNKVYEENSLVNNGDLLLFGAMPKDAFLRRILRCYNIDLYYNLEEKKIMFKDLDSNKFLDNKSDSPLWSSKNLNIRLVCEKGDLIINIKRKPNVDISLRVDLVNSIDWQKCDNNTYEENNLNYNNDDLIEFKYSKYGDYEYKNNTSGYSFKYNTETLNIHKAKPNTINIISFFNQNSLSYKLENGELSTFTCQSSNNKFSKNEGLIPFDECKDLFTNDLDTIKPIINNDVIDLKKLVNRSRLEYLKSLEQNLLKSIADYSEQISELTKKIKVAKEKISLISTEIFKLVLNNKFHFLKISKSEKGTCYTKK